VKIVTTDTYPRMIGTLDGADVWEDEPGAYWVDDPDNPGYLHSSRRPRLDGETTRARRTRNE
jgi:hypothetical protein